MERLGRLMDDLSVEGNNSDFSVLRKSVADLLATKGEFESDKGFNRILWAIAKLDFSGKAAHYKKFSTTVEYKGENVPIEISTSLSEKHSVDPERASFWINIGGVNALSYQISTNLNDSNRAFFVGEDLFGGRTSLLPVDIIELKDLISRLS